MRIEKRIEVTNTNIKGGPKDFEPKWWPMQQSAFPVTSAATTAFPSNRTLMWWTVLTINKCTSTTHPVRLAYFLPNAIRYFLFGLFQCLFQYFWTSWSTTFEAYLQAARIALLCKHTKQSSKRSLASIYNYLSESGHRWNELFAEN